jgi:hypothetical protein
MSKAHALTKSAVAPELAEHQIQRSVFDNFKARSAPHVFAFHPKNGGIHQIGRRAGINEGLGVVPGIPDVIVIRRDGDCVDVFALELKRESRRNRKMTEHEFRQGEVRGYLEKCGVTCGVAYGLDDALIWLEGHGLLAGKKV